jgi:gamma-glutamyltranspeptidase/glutathione hydrolase
MNDFSVQPGTPNAFGLVGGDANAIAPFKRPLSSMSPTLVLKGNRPIMTVGAAGGPRIITQVLLALVNRLTLGDSPEMTLARPRFHHQWSPDVLYVEESMPKAIFDDLKSRGHNVQWTNTAGATQTIILDIDGRSFIGVSEPRVPGKAAGH